MSNVRQRGSEISNRWLSKLLSHWQQCIPILHASRCRALHNICQKHIARLPRTISIRNKYPFLGERLQYKQCRYCLTANTSIDHHGEVNDWANIFELLNNGNRSNYERKNDSFVIILLPKWPWHYLNYDAIDWARRHEYHYTYFKTQPIHEGVLFNLIKPWSNRPK